MKRKSTAVFIAVAALVSVIALAAYAAPGGPKAAGPQAYPIGIQGQASVPVDKAQSTALAKVGGGTVAMVETKYPRHGMEYKFIIVNGDSRYDVHVDAYTGNITNYKMRQITMVYNAAGAIDAESAKAIALKTVGGGVIIECKLDYRPRAGASIYHIHVANGQYEHCVELLAATGAVYKAVPRHKP